MTPEKIKETREAKGLTQTEVARKCNVSLAAYRLWETGGGNPSEVNLQKLMAALGVLPFDTED